MAETFGQLVRRLRKDRRLTQEQLASEAGLDQSTISAIELDKGERTVGTVSKLAGAFGAEPLDWLPLAGLVPSPTVVAEPPPPMRADIPDAFLSDRAVEEYCLNHADPVLREQARRGKEALAPAAFTRMCRRTYRAHYANSVNIWGAALDDREPCDHDTFGPRQREG